MKDINHSFNSIFRWQLFSTAVIAIIQFITIILLGRLLESKELGSFAIFQLVFRFALFCLDPGMFFSLVQKHESNRNLRIKLFLIQSLYVICSIIVLIILSNTNEVFRELDLNLLMNGLVIIVIIGFGAYSQSELIRHYKQKEIAIAQTLGYLLELILVVSFCTRYDPILVFSYGIVVRFLIFYLICYYYLYLSKMNFESTLVLSSPINEYVNQSNYNIGSQIMSYFQGQYDTFVIVGLFGLPTLGAYILTTEISYVIFSKVNPLFNKAIFPVVSKSYKENSNSIDLIRESFSSYLILIVLCYALFWIYRFEIFSWAYNEKASELSHYAMYLLPIALSKAINNILNSYILALGESKKIFLWNIALLILNYVVFALFYWQKWSMDFFLIFITIYSVLLMLLVFILLQSVLKNNNVVESLIQWHSIASLLFIVAAIYLVSFFVLNPYLSIFISIIISIVLLYFLEKRRLLAWLNFSIV